MPDSELTARKPAPPSRRAFVWLLCFVAGVAVGYGLVRLDRAAEVPRLEPTDIFEVSLPGGELVRLNYAEVAREREELVRLRQRVVQLQRAGAAGALARMRPPAPPPQTPGIALPGTADEGEVATEGAAGTEPEKPNLGELFAKIFEQPVMKEIMQGQVRRTTGELADVLDLTEAQREKLEGILQKRQMRARPRIPAGSGAGGTTAPPPSPPPLEEELRPILSAAQVRRYMEYTEKKETLGDASPAEREALEVSWRLDLAEEQEEGAREILQDHWEELQSLSPAPGPDDDLSPAGRMNEYFQDREALNRRTAERMKEVLDAEQLAAFTRYQEEKERETQLLRKLMEPADQEGLPFPGVP